MSGIRDTLADVLGPDAVRPLGARSVIASTMLGAEPPELPIRTIVRCGELFGISSGAVRTAVSRMVADGALAVDADRRRYRISGPLVARRRRQDEARSAPADEQSWDGTWEQWIVVASARPAAERQAFRSAAVTLRLAEVREGVWMRPSNLSPRRHADAAAVVVTQAVPMQVVPPDSRRLAADLWDLDGWAETAGRLRDLLAAHRPVLGGNDATALADGFLLSAAVLRHLLADPLLPAALVGRGWPGTSLRATYDRYDLTYKASWRTWFREQPAA